jgi:hypothetical protein
MECRRVTSVEANPVLSTRLNPRLDDPFAPELETTIPIATFTG